jgi:hypothetical protein
MEIQSDERKILLLRSLNSFNFFSHSEWSPFATLRTGSAELRNLFQAKSDFSAHGVCPELVSGFGRNDIGSKQFDALSSNLSSNSSGEADWVLNHL